MLDEDITGEDDQDGAIQALPKGDAEDLLEIIRRGIQGYNKTNEPVVQVASISIAYEINKLSKLKDQGIITATEFEEMKNRLIKNFSKK